MSIDSQHDLTFLQSVLPTHPDSHLFLQMVIDDMRQRGFEIPTYLPIANDNWGAIDRQFVQHYLRHVATLCGIAELQRQNVTGQTDEAAQAASDEAQARIATLAQTVSELQDRIDILDAALVTAQTRHNDAQTRLNEALARHQSDMAYLSEQLLEEATNRNWCSDYDKFVTRVNGTLLYELQPREREYEVEATFTITARTTVTASSYDDAHDQANSLDYDFRGYGNWSVEDVVDGPSDINVSES